MPKKGVKVPKIPKIPRLKAMAESQEAELTQEEFELEQDTPLTLGMASKMISKQSVDINNALKMWVKEIGKKLDPVLESIPHFEQRLTTLELDWSVLNERLDNLEKQNETLTADNNKLKQRVINLESQSRRNNIRIIGLKEGIEKDKPPLKFFTSLLTDLFGEEAVGKDFVLERAHRSLSAKDTSGTPRSVIIRFHHFQKKETILRLARSKKDLTYQGARVRILEDYCPEIVALRKVYHEVMLELYKKGFKPTLLYPARLRITHGTHKNFLSSPEEAWDFLKRKTLGSSTAAL